MERTETEHLSFNVYEAAQGVEWPSTDPHFPCVGKSCGGNKVDIVRGPDCTEQDLAEMMERFENNWRDLNGVEVPDGGLTFNLR